MRCKICLETYRVPPPAMKENQICTNCQYNLKNNLELLQEQELKRIQNQKNFKEGKKASPKIEHIPIKNKDKAGPKQSVKFEEQLTNSQKTMDDILSEKPELREIYLKLDKRLKKINPNKIREFINEI